MSDMIRLNFGPPKFTVRRFPVPRKPGEIFFEMPAGAQLIGIDAPDHDPTAILFFWAVPSEDRQKIRSKYLVVEEGQPFTVEECSGIVELEDGTFYEEVHVHLEVVGFWTELNKEDGAYRTFHVLEIIDDEDHDQGEPELEGVKDADDSG